VRTVEKNVVANRKHAFRRQLLCRDQLEVNPVPLYQFAGAGDGRPEFLVLVKHFMPPNPELCITHAIRAGKASSAGSWVRERKPLGWHQACSHAGWGEQMSKQTLALLVVMGSLGCMPASLSSADIAAYKSLGSQIEAAVSLHRSNMLGGTDLGACPSETGRYQAEVSPLLDQMSSMSPSIDACAQGMGHAGMANLGQTCNSMHHELETHVQQGCMGNLGQIQSEAIRHSGAMGSYLDHAMQTTDAMAGMMPSNGMMSSENCRM
jgi:hypothetical protein